MIQVTPGEWPEAAEWGSRARRLGPLRWSDLGPRRLETPDPDGPLPAWLSTSLDKWWEAAGCPDPLTVVVVSGDDGRLAAAVLGCGMACAPALRYVVVHPDLPDGPSVVGRHLSLESPAFLYPTGQPEDSDDAEADAAPAAQGVGPLATFLTGLPAVGDAGPAPVIVAAGLLSRLRSDVLEWRDGQWWECRVAGGGSDGGLDEMAVPVDPRRDVAGQLGLGGAPAPGRYRLLSGAADWLRQALSVASDGILAVVDDWSGPAPPDGLGLEQLRRVREPSSSGPAPLGGGWSVVEWRLG